MNADKAREALVSRILQVLQALTEKLATRTWKGWERRNMVGCMTVHPATGVAIFIRLYFEWSKYFRRRRIPAGKVVKPWGVPFNPKQHDHWYTLEVIDLVRTRRRSKLLYFEAEEGEPWYPQLAAMFTKAQELSNFHSADEPQESLDMTLDWLAQELTK